MEELDLETWEPRTKLGRMVKDGEITSLSEIFKRGRRPREVEIVDTLVPDLEEEILNVNLVQRMHRSGRRLSFRVTAAVGNRDGVIGIAHTSGGEVAPSIRKAIEVAKLQVREIRRGCGSWECGCGRPHSIPFEVTGQKGSVRITLKPAPRGLGIAASEIPQTILRLAGIEDVWTTSKGQTRTTINFGLATFDALKKTSEMAIRDRYRDQITTGEVGGEVD
ncbi:30S ribosomal protein S5 [candidate division MSBL1 archaeon SCGC-AAA259O05]|uniref:Small ribosomal subunit protein uS5 n=1 Tax=candidate division MSBL1 archaeon SCGC-AAA259O05 TaxID=1698271 RepID=A0A133V3P6_9EURY|nr:30S ribosomal protein S5 [candidate division MSBL1 archaeon SCGC-AAA259O05]